MDRHVPFDHLPRAERDRQFSPSRSAKDPWGTLARHEAETGKAAALQVAADAAYGPGARQRLDVWRPAVSAPVPCLLWVHGGFWQEGTKAGSGFMAAPLAAAGWATAGIGYTLAPEARLGAIVAEIAAAVLFLRREAPRLGLDPDRLVLGGHSAGAHLAAAILAGCGGADAAAALGGVVAVSGVFDLAPVAASYVNDRVGIDAAEVAALSPLSFDPRHDVPVHVVVGADEPEAFRLHSHALARVWGPSLSRLTVHEAPGRDHFDVLDELADPASPSFAAVLAMGAPR